MIARWMTLPKVAPEIAPEIARVRHISPDAARRLVDATDCPKAFRPDGPVDLI